MAEQSLIRYVFQDRKTEHSYSTEERRRLRHDTRSLLQDLADYGIALRHLCEKSVSWEDRNKILNLSLILINSTPVVQTLVERRELDVLEAARATGISHRYIEEFRELLVAYMLLLGTEEHSFLSRQLSIGTRWGGATAPVSNDMGFKLKGFGITAAVLTPYGEFRFLDPSDRNADIGDFIEGRPSLVKPRRAFLLGAAALLLVLCVILFSFVFNRPVKGFTVLGDAEASFSFNRFGRLIETVGLDNSGRKILEDIVFSDRKPDSTLAGFIREGIQEGAISKDSDLTVVVVEGTFPESDFQGEELKRQLSENNLSLRVNLGGGKGFILDP